MFSFEASSEIQLFPPRLKTCALTAGIVFFKKQMLKVSHSALKVNVFVPSNDRRGPVKRFGVLHVREAWYINKLIESKFGFKFIRLLIRLPKLIQIC